MKISRILVSGASGLIGTSLVRELTGNSIHVIKLVRQASSDLGDGYVQELFWNPAGPEPVSDLNSLDGIDAAVHLSGASVADHRWTTSYKRKIVDSRVLTTRALAGMLAGLARRPKVLVSASAIGIYGDRGSEILTEKSPPGTGFFPETCQAWEAATRDAEEAGIRVVHLRFGVVLDANGGALAKMLPLFRLGMGGRLGGGGQWMPWVTLREVLRIIQFSLSEDGLSGPVNAVSPNPVTNAEFTRDLARVVHRPAILPAPGFALRMAFGQMAQEALLSSARVLPARLAEAGFQFSDPGLLPALQLLLAPAR